MQLELLHRVILRIVRQQYQLIVDGHSCYQRIRKSQRSASAAVIPFDLPGKFGDRKRNWEKLQAAKELTCSRLFVWPHSCVNLCHMNGAACQNMSLFHQVQKKECSILLVIQSVDENAGVEEVDGHSACH